MTPKITAFAHSPDRGEGHARSFRVRWALEEAGQPYDEQLLSMAALKEPAHRARHPFGKIPTYEEGDLALFESGAIVLHIARTRPGLLPADEAGRERAIVWLFAALSTVEPPIVEREAFLILEKHEPWFAQRKPLLDERVRERLDELAAFLGERKWLEGEFTAGDLMMITVLRRLRDGGQSLLDEFPALDAYVGNGEARPAFRRALAGEKHAYAVGGR